MRSADGLAAGASLVAAIPLVGQFAGGAKLASKGGKKLFRVVDDVELADIKKTGGFRTVPGGFEGKQFVDNLDDAKALQQKFSKFFGGNQTIVPAQIPQPVLDRASRVPFADIPKGQAITIPKNDLPSVVPKL